MADDDFVDEEAGHPLYLPPGASDNLQGKFLSGRESENVEVRPVNPMQRLNTDADARLTPEIRQLHDNLDYTMGRPEGRDPWVSSPTARGYLHGLNHSISTYRNRRFYRDLEGGDALLFVPEPGRPQPPYDPDTLRAFGLQPISDITPARPQYTLQDVVERQRELNVAIEELQHEVFDLRAEVAELHRRMGNIIRPARVTAVDAQKGTARVTFATDGDGQDVETGELRWMMRSGSQREWDPPKVGEQVVMVSPGGEISMLSWIMHGGFTEDNPQNHDQLAEYKRTVGNAEFFMKNGEVRLKVGDASVKLTADTLTTHSANFRGEHSDVQWTQGG